MMENILHPGSKEVFGTKANLVVDFGNTLTKVAVYQDNELICLEKTTLLTTALLDKLRLEYFPDFAIISSVIEIPDDIRHYLETNFKFYELTHQTPVPVKNLYKTPETLGKDRLAAVIGASALFPGNDCLVIDAGTCITFDFIDNLAQYHGGSISPGISLRFKALHNFTSRLPLVSHRNFEGLTGSTTEESILSGVLNGTTAELNCMINNYCDIYPEIKVVITGGDMIYFDKKLKNNIFAVPNLVLMGLNVILDFNVKEK
jgi:type III pantothenate kinase